MRLQERFLVLRGQPEQRQHLVAAARAIDQAAPRVSGGERAQRIGARHVHREQPPVIVDRGVLEAGAVLVEGRQRLARGELLGNQRHDLFERADGGLRIFLAGQLAVALPQLGAPLARRRVAVRRREPRQRASQLVGQAEVLGQLVAEGAQRDERRLVLRILDQRLFQQLRRLADVPRSAVSRAASRRRSARSLGSFTSSTSSADVCAAASVAPVDRWSFRTFSSSDTCSSPGTL